MSTRITLSGLTLSLVVLEIEIRDMQHFVTFCHRGQLSWLIEQSTVLLEQLACTEACPMYSATICFLIASPDDAMACMRPANCGSDRH